MSSDFEELIVISTIVSDPRVPSTLQTFRLLISPCPDRRKIRRHNWTSLSSYRIYIPADVECPTRFCAQSRLQRHSTALRRTLLPLLFFSGGKARSRRYRPQYPIMHCFCRRGAGGPLQRMRLRMIGGWGCLVLLSSFNYSSCARAGVCHG